MPRAIQRSAVVTLALGLSAAGFAQAPAQGAPPAGAAKKVTSAPTSQAAPAPSAAPKSSAAPKPSATQPPMPLAGRPLQPLVQQQAPPQPVVPPRPEQMPPQAPQVTYQNGQLSIVAQNATLSAILAAVRSRTGAQVEMPAEASNDRVAAQLGPGNPRDVMASLLQGSRFDYIVLGSVNDPNVLSQVILTTRRGGPATAPADTGQASGSPAGVAQPNQPGLFRGGVSRPEIVEEEEPEPEPVPEPQPELVPAPAAENLPQQPGVYQPGVPGVVGQPVPGQEGQPVAPGQPNPQVPGQVRTPEQLLQELQRMQQDQQQQQQQQQRKQQQQQN